MKGRQTEILDRHGQLRLGEAFSFSRKAQDIGIHGGHRKVPWIMERKPRYHYL
jgi:hypothetical protein